MGKTFCQPGKVQRPSLALNCGPVKDSRRSHPAMYASRNTVGSTCLRPVVLSGRDGHGFPLHTKRRNSVSSRPVQGCKRGSVRVKSLPRILSHSFRYYCELCGMLLSLTQPVSMCSTPVTSCLTCSCASRYWQQYAGLLGMQGGGDRADKGDSQLITS